MSAFLAFSRRIDALNERVGRSTYWLVLIAVLTSAGNAIVRKTLNMSSNALLEIQWYLFSAIFLLCAGYTFLKNDHVRIDVLAARLSPKLQNLIDVIGILFFLLPMAVLIIYMAWPIVMFSYHTGEVSANPGGLIRWPVKILLPLGLGLLALQGVSELIKRIGFLVGACPNPLAKHEGPSSEEELALEIMAHKDISGEELK